MYIFWPYRNISVRNTKNNIPLMKHFDTTVYYDCFLYTTKNKNCLFIKSEVKIVIDLKICSWNV